MVGPHEFQAYEYLIFAVLFALLAITLAAIPLVVPAKHRRWGRPAEVPRVTK